jgi:hypothetical protein
MPKALHNLNVELALTWEHGDQYKATVTTTDSCYRAGELKIGLPPRQEGAALVDYLRFAFTHEGDLCGKLFAKCRSRSWSRSPRSSAR